MYGALSRTRTWLPLVLMSTTLALGCTNLHTDSGTGAYVEPGETGTTDLRSGQCIESLDEMSLGSVPVVDCGEPHRYEVSATVSVEEDLSDYDRAELDRLAGARCADAFTEYVGVDEEILSESSVYLMPSEESWDRGDRRVNCLVASGEPTTGSMRLA
ncbi:MAG: septum formation family protein [Actinobacteria bacterium]|nr:septum formation family protein [Actinomycetota bacterium]MCB9390073.1 septum formation family protein [Acidimicrobiia bacterium]